MERFGRGLAERVQPDGVAGYVQQIGQAPGAVDADSKREYGTGAFLLAGCEVLRAVGGAKPVTDPCALLQAAEQLATAREPVVCP